MVSDISAGASSLIKVMAATVLLRCRTEKGGVCLKREPERASKRARPHRRKRLSVGSFDWLGRRIWPFEAVRLLSNPQAFQLSRLGVALVSVLAFRNLRHSVSHALQRFLQKQGLARVTRKRLLPTQCSSIHVALINAKLDSRT